MPNRPIFLQLPVTERHCLHFRKKKKSLNEDFKNANFFFQDLKKISIFSDFVLGEKDFPLMTCCLNSPQFSMLSLYKGMCVCSIRGRTNLLVGGGREGGQGDKMVPLQYSCLENPMD